MKYSAFVILAATALPMIGCNKDGGTGPIDGTFGSLQLTCNGVVQSGGSGVVTLIITNTTGNLKTVDGSCTLNEPQAIAYPSGTQVNLRGEARSCEPAGCAGADCNGAASENGSTFTHSLSGNTLTLTRTSAAADEDCAVGETIVYTGTKQ